MTAGEKARLVLERLVVLLWLCTPVVLGLRALAGSDAQPPADAWIPPAVCTPGADALLCNADRWPAPVADPEAGRYLVTAHVAACPLPLPGGPSADEAASRAQSECGLGPVQPLPPETDLCAALHQDPCTPRWVTREDLRPCARILAGPVTGEGTAAPQATPVPPFLTVLPDVVLDGTVARLLRWQSRWQDSPPLAAWRGVAGPGWLVIPVTRFPDEAESGALAERLLHAAAGAVSGPPRPHPVLVDLGGLADCPTAADLQSAVAAVTGMGFTVIGQHPFTDKPIVIGRELTADATPYARLYSLRVTTGESACEALPAVPWTQAATAMARRLVVESAAAGEAVVLVHWVGPPPRPAQAAAVTRALADLGVPIVVGFAGGLPVGARSTTTGIAVDSLGTLVSPASILPAARYPAGAVLRCHQVAPGGRSCELLPAAHSLGQAVPVPGAECAGCANLPHAYFASLFGSQCSTKEQ